MLRSIIKTTLKFTTITRSVVPRTLHFLYTPRRYYHKSFQLFTESLLKPKTTQNTLFAQDALLITRNIQIPQVLFGFEQANKYQIQNQSGDVVGYIFEQDSLGKGIMRQITVTHRSFTAAICDKDLNVLMKIYRPFFFYKSSMYIQNIDGETIGEIHQRWHPFRRKYDLYVGKKQFAEVDAGFLSWDFEMKDINGNVIASVNKNWTDFTREIFTDANQYAVRLGSKAGGKNLSEEEKAIVLASSIAVDFDYFSRTHGRPFLFWSPFPLPMPAPTPQTVPEESNDSVGTNIPWQENETSLQTDEDLISDEEMGGIRYHEDEIYYNEDEPNEFNDYNDWNDDYFTSDDDDDYY